jgi:signal transduction histidine kinase/ActR/RegA family two-component response regulator
MIDDARRRASDLSIPLAERTVSEALLRARELAQADVALLFTARDREPLACLGVDARLGSWWAGAGAVLRGLIVQPSRALNAARREWRVVAVPAADLPLFTPRGVRFVARELPPWATAVPITNGRSTDALLILLGDRPLPAAEASAVTAPLAACAEPLAKLAHLGARQSARRAPPASLLTKAIAAADVDGARFALALALPRIGVIIARRDGGVVAANAVGEQALANIQDGESRRLLHAGLRALLDDRGAIKEIATIADDGTHRYLRAALAEAPGDDALLLLTLEDVTDERLMHERLLQSEKMASIGQLVSGVAHELNNPLTGIMGFAQLMLARADLPSEVRREITTVFDEADRAARIVQNLLSFARRRKAEKERVDLNEIVRRVLELRNYDLRVHNIEPRTRLTATLAPVLADPHQIQQVLLNVIRNAEHAIRACDRAGSISVSTFAAKDYARLTVVDDGSGIPPENLRRIFDPFFTTKSPGEGTGLGLTIVYGIIEEHGGRLHVESQPGTGTTLSIELPLAPAELAVAQKPGATAATRADSGHSILVIDDEASIREVLFILLRRDGHDVETVADGLAALERLAERDFDLIMTDVRMPGVDGIEFFNRVRAWNPAVAARIIFTTGDIVNPTTRDFLASVPNLHLQKPFSLADVREMIAALLQH